MTAETIAMLETELARWQSYSWTPSPSYFAASIMSDVQEALFLGLDKTAREGLKHAAYFLDKDDRLDWAKATHDLLDDLDDGRESRVIDGLNDIKRQIFDVIRRDKLI